MFTLLGYLQHILAQPEDTEEGNQEETESEKLEGADLVLI